MSPEEKDDIMRRFADVSATDGIDVLVSTTVIEVGVDVPNASTMVVLDADRFGVSQLHKLRGRVGRGGVPGLALFVTYAEENPLARDRVEAVASTLDGFEMVRIASRPVSVLPPISHDELLASEHSAASNPTITSVNNSIDSDATTALGSPPWVMIAPVEPESVLNSPAISPAATATSVEPS
jgi:superfamily II DNA/RNA helicase